MHKEQHKATLPLQWTAWALPHEASGEDGQSDQSLLHCAWDISKRWNQHATELVIVLPYMGVGTQLSYSVYVVLRPLQE